MVSMRAAGKKIQLPYGRILARDMRVEIDKTAISNLFSAAGEIGREGRSSSELLLAKAVQKAPRGTGRRHHSPKRPSGNLKRSHSVRVNYSATRRRVRITLKNSADYALFVHEGTGGVLAGGFRAPGAKPIRPNTAKFLYVPVEKGAKVGIGMDWVTGQRPKRWMIRAANDVLSKYGINPLLNPNKSHTTHTQ